MRVNTKDYRVIKLLGKGKSGYSYLVEDDCNFKYVLKKIHHEPCDYYHFDDKLKVEIDDYNYLKDIIDIPCLIDVDYENEIILKEYIDGKTIKELIDNDVDISIYIKQIKDISIKCKKFNINIDYYPTNFVPLNSSLYYIDYECNVYNEKWNFENWGINYWRK